MAKVEREKILHFKFSSKMTDIGEYKKTFKILRKTPSLDVKHVNTKSMLTNGVTPVDEIDAQSIDTLATLMVYFKLLDDKGVVVQTDLGNGQLVDSTEWVDEILDPFLLMALHKEWADYQQSFYVKAESKDEASANKAPVQS